MPRVVCTGVALALAAAVATGAEIAPWLRTPAGWDIEIAPRNEPGGRFVIEGRLLGAGDSLPITGANVYVYHVDQKGWYSRKGDKYPRLAGVLRTDRLGRYRVRSILPGRYESGPHVHFEAWGQDLPANSWFVNLYKAPGEKDDPAWGRTPGKHYIAPDSPQAPVTRDSKGVFHTEWDLLMSRAFVLPGHQDSLRRGLVEH